MGVLREEQEELLHPRLERMQPTDLITAFTGDIEPVTLIHAADPDPNGRRVRATRSRHGHRPVVQAGSLIRVNRLLIGRPFARRRSVATPQHQLAIQLRHASPGSVRLARLQREGGALLLHHAVRADPLGRFFPP